MVGSLPADSKKTIVLNRNVKIRREDFGAILFVFEGFADGRSKFLYIKSKQLADLLFALKDDPKDIDELLQEIPEERRPIMVRAIDRLLQKSILSELK